MKKELDKELYPDYVYPEFTPDPNEPFREPIAKLGKKITDRIPQKLGVKKITRTGSKTWCEKTEDTGRNRETLRSGRKKM